MKPPNLFFINQNLLFQIFNIFTIDFLTSRLWMHTLGIKKTVHSLLVNRDEDFWTVCLN